MGSATLAVVHDLEAYRRRREEAKLAAAQPCAAVMPVMWCYVWMPLPYTFAFSRPFQLAAALADEEDLSAVVGHNLRLLRSRRGYSLERLAQISGVSRAMLGQIELGRSAPTINLLWKVARALEIPLSALTGGPHSHGPTVLKAADSKVLISSTREFTSRALFPFDSQRRVEFYELRLSPKGLEKADAHATGTVENLVVSKGTVEIAVETQLHVLEVGDAILFEADVPHHYRNVGQIEALMFLVMTYVDPIG